MQKEWKKVKLKNIASIKTGPFGSLLHQSDYKEFGTPIITVEHLSDLGIIYKNLPYISDEDKQRLSSYILNEGDIVFSRVGSVDRSSPVSKNESGWLFSGRLLRVRPIKSEVNYHFLNHFFHERYFKHRIRSLAVGGTMPSLNTKILENVVVILPSLREQKKIAEILSTWDEAIALTEKLIAAKQKLKKGLTQQLVFGEISTQNNQDINSKQYRMFSIPEYWKYVQLGSVCKQITKKNNTKDDLPVLSCTKHYGLVDSLQYFGKQIFSQDTSGYKIVEKNDFAYATNHIEEGSIGYQNIYKSALVSPMYTVFKTNSTNIDDNYLFKLLKTETYRHIFEINTSASVDRRGSLRWNQFSLIKIPLPPMTEQKAITNILDNCENELFLLIQQKNNLQKQKRGLMQKLLTGEWRVNE